MIPQLRELKDLLANAQQTALGAHNTSEDAEREAAAGIEVRGSTCSENLNQERPSTSSSRSALVFRTC